MVCEELEFTNVKVKHIRFNHLCVAMCHEGESGSRNIGVFGLSASDLKSFEAF